MKSATAFAMKLFVLAIVHVTVVRGYERIAERLRALGARITREPGA